MVDCSRDPSMADRAISTGIANLLASTSAVARGPAKKSARIVLTVVAAMGMAARGQQSPAPCDAATFKPVKGDRFDPAVDTFFQPASFFGAQPTTQFGNMTRYNPKLRNFPDFNENA